MRIVVFFFGDSTKDSTLFLSRTPRGSKGTPNFYSSGTPRPDQGLHFTHFSLLLGTPQNDWGLQKNIKIKKI